MSEFTSLVKSRRSANNFMEGVEITRPELEEIFTLAKYAPSAFNLQHTHYLVVTDPVLKEKIYESCKQYKVHSASAVILVLGNRYAYQAVEKINEGMHHLGILSKQELDRTVETVTGIYEGKGESFMKEEAIRNASLSAMLFMLSAKDKGWDTCPMIGFDPGAIKEILEIPDGYETVMMITIGKEKLSSQRPRGYRKPNGEFVSYNGM